MEAASHVSQVESVTGPIPSHPLLTTFETLTRRLVDEWIATRRVEDLTLDFKTAPQHFESSEERQALAKAISGFANAAGGLIVWGVRAKRDTEGLDAAQAVSPIRNPAKFLSNLTSYSGSAVSPAIPGVIHRLIDDASVAVTLVPESVGGPYMANLGHGKYFTRAGSSFIQMEHFQVVDAFARRQRPDLRVSVEVLANSRTILVSLVNIGPVSAKAPYVELRPSGPWVLSPHGVDGNGRWNLPAIGHGGRENSSDPRFGGDLMTVIHPSTQLDVCVLVWTGNLEALPETVKLSYSVAAEDVPMTQDDLVVERRAGFCTNS